ncbi:MAG: hypothetical protein ACRENK_08325 [Gemmatimonadaceae bacterium]
MKLPRVQDIPSRATLVVVVLALVAGVVMGAPWNASQAPPPPPDVGSPSTSEASNAPLNIEGLERRKVVGTVPDLFKRPPPPGPSAATLAAIPVTPPAPIAPPLPFKYLGRMSDGTRTVVFLESAQSLFSAGVGDTVASIYRIEAIADASVTFKYMPLGQNQTLPVPPRP